MFSKEEVERYSRHFLLDGVGVKGQKKLSAASVLIVGAGGLGAPCAMYLAAAGIGRIGIIDADIVSLSNLQRQIIHGTKDLERPKVQSARDTMVDINPNIRVDTYPGRLTPENAAALIGDYDLVVDGADNFQTKFLINDTCVMLEKPFVHAGILRFDAQIMTYVPGYPCYRCVFEEIPAADSIPGCSEAGVLGAMAGIAGCIQALEVLKYVIGTGELLTGKILVIDGRAMTFRRIEVGKRNPRCRVCGDDPDITDVRQCAQEYSMSGCCGTEYTALETEREERGWK